MSFEMLLLAPGIPSIASARTAQADGRGPRAIEAEAAHVLRRARAAGHKLLEERRWNDAIRLEFRPADAPSPADAFTSTDAPRPADVAASPTRFRAEFSPDGTVFVQLWGAGDDTVAEARCRALVEVLLPDCEVVGANPGWEPPE
ncbi:hypothetical protein [Schumannella sp. 10F1B-5-1]|uniref:hypothetical protein n=1 Tax=Schumannella sp. 10F1B-5-1 TaxID=2590780 RepID=UPI001130B1DE|nr:hypothetical protein [Schumannella sp. 10F1B-5-1]TPW72903.1 hypothetical protein FJ658_06500 [Schumannella sp. 10F1B-5-1]